MTHSNDENYTLFTVLSLSLQLCTIIHQIVVSCLFIYEAANLKILLSCLMNSFWEKICSSIRFSARLEKKRIRPKSFIYRIPSNNVRTPKMCYPNREGNVMPILFWGNKFLALVVELLIRIKAYLIVSLIKKFCGLQTKITQETAFSLVNHDKLQSTKRFIEISIYT